MSEKIWSMSCYIPVFNIITCILASVRMVHSKLCLLHARQGLVLFGLWFLTIIIALVSQTLSVILWIVVLLLHAVGLVISFQLKDTKIPVIGLIATQVPEYYLFILLTGKKPE